MPPYVGLFTTLQLLKETEYCGNLYYESYLNAFGPRHTSTVLSVVERSKYEWLKYPINFPEDTSVLTLEGVTEYQPLLSIMLRIAKLKEGINETNSTTDLHLEEGKKELVFALWCTHIIDQCYDSKVRMTKKPRTIRVDEKYWKPYNSKQPINVSPEMILLKKRISLIAARVAKHKVIPKWYNLAIKKLDRERILNKGMSKLILIFKHFLLKKRKLAVITIKKAWYSYKKKMDKKANEIKKLEEEKFKQQEKEKLEQLKSKKKEKKKLEQVPTNICYRKANLNELRRRLEYYVIHNIFNDPYLLSFRRRDGSFPFHVFYTFPSLKPIIRGIGEPIEAIAEAANLSCQIEAFSHGIRPRIY
jgi:hypothetical protein